MTSSAAVRREDRGEPCRFLEWDSAFFRARIASASAPAPDAAAMERVLAWCRDNRIDCLYLLSDADDATTIGLAQANGFRLTDIRVTLQLEATPANTVPIAQRPQRSSQVGAIRPATSSDLPELRALAAASHTQTRFWADERFERSACAELYATWIERGLLGQADAVWVAEHRGRAAGYFTCHRRTEGTGEIGLVAVAPAAQGIGLGHALLDRGLAWFLEEGCARVSVVTQGANVAAQRLYQSAGFRTCSVQVWHHRWFAGTGSARA